MDQNGIQGKMYKILHSVYKHVKCCVNSEERNSDYFDRTNGLKQGCKLSPVLFSLIMMSLIKEVTSKGKHGVKLNVNDTELFILLFADDIVFLADTVHGLQNQINNRERASRQLGLTVNAQKTKVMVFRLGGHIAGRERWCMEDQRLEVVSEYKYLRIPLSTKLSTNGLLSN